MDVEDTTLELTEAQIEEQEAPEIEEGGGKDDEAGETIISFGDDAEDGEDDTPLVRKLRDQIRDRDRKLAQMRREPANNEDPEPVIPELKEYDDPEFEYDTSRFNGYIRKRDKAVAAHAEWKVRQAERDNARKRVADDQAKQVEQQKRALGVTDYDDRAASVRDRLNDQQMAVLINATDNPAKLIYALGRSEIRLEELAGIDNLAKFAARVGQLERDIKVGKKQAPAPETRVRGATAAAAIRTNDKELERLEREADRTGDRTKIQQYKRQLRRQAA